VSAGRTDRPRTDGRRLDRAAGGAPAQGGGTAPDGAGTVGRRVAAYGAWASPIRAADLAVAGIALGAPRPDGSDLCWLEGRPGNRGRQTVVRRRADGTIEDVTPPDFNARTRVHEYGGGAYLPADGIVYASSFDDGRAWRFEHPGEPGSPLTPEGAWRYADFELDRGRRRLYAVREDHTAGGVPRSPTEARNELVAIALDRPPEEAVTAIAGGHDFVAAPRLSPDGRRLAWLTWDHPAMPWDATELWVAEIAADGSLGEPERVAGGPDVAVTGPCWAPDGALVFAADWTGWWNLYRWTGADEASVPLAPVDAEFADPAWVLGRSSVAFLGDGTLYAVCRREGRDVLVRVEGDGRIEPVAIPHTELEGLWPLGGDRLAFVGGAPDRPTAVVICDPRSGSSEEVRRAIDLDLDPALVSRPRAMTFPTVSGPVGHALYYPPTNPGWNAPAGELPPLYVEIHGGPTANASSGVSLAIQYLTSRGIAVLDVDYRGSTGYGRVYRDLLRGSWGIVDMEDAVAAALFAAASGLADPRRMAIAGGSAGGYTTLRVLTAAPGAFAAGISHFGVADLGALARDTHKFESRYLDGLVGPWPEAEAVYRDRSPVNAVEAIDVPVLLLQGLDDRVVPPAQTRTMETALRQRGVPVAALYFEGEGHGFRGAPAIVAATEAELAFLGRVFGFEPADDLPPLDLAGWPGVAGAGDSNGGGPAAR
jgi:dipeptidyl aminopeptidase/acylaminoacyl peptidase